MVSRFLQEESFKYKEDKEPLIQKLLLLDNVEFQLSQNGRLVTKLLKHQQSSDSKDEKETATYCISSSKKTISFLKLLLSFCKDS